jgi:hypothetical protein
MRLGDAIDPLGSVPTQDPRRELELIPSPVEPVHLQQVVLHYTNDAGYHVQRIFRVDADCELQGQQLRAGQMASALFLPEVPVHAISDYPWQAVWESFGPSTTLAAADRTLYEELEHYLETQAAMLRGLLGRSLRSLLVPFHTPRLEQQVSSLVQLPDGVVRTPSMFGDPIRVPRVTAGRTSVKVTFPANVTAILPVIDGRLITLSSFDMSVYAVCCMKWELAGGLGDPTLTVTYSPSEVCCWLGLDPDSGKNLQLVKDSMERLGGITFNLPRYTEADGDYRAQVQPLEKHEYDPLCRWGRFELPRPVAEELIAGNKTHFPREVLNRLRKVSPTAVFLYAFLETHRGWDDHPSGNREIRISVAKLREHVNRRDSNESRLRSDLRRALAAIQAEDPKYVAGEVGKTPGRQYVLRVLKAHGSSRSSRVTAAPGGGAPPEVPKTIRPPGPHPLEEAAETSEIARILLVRAGLRRPPR